MNMGMTQFTGRNKIYKIHQVQNVSVYKQSCSRDSTWFAADESICIANVILKTHGTWTGNSLVKEFTSKQDKRRGACIAGTKVTSSSL